VQATDRRDELLIAERACRPVPAAGPIVRRARYLERAGDEFGGETERLLNFDEGAHLRGAQMAGMDCEGANLSGANLEGADLSGANLRRADLRRATLWNADLSGADLTGAILLGARLNGVQSDEKTRWPVTYRP